jgi:predicted dehydrogenase
MQKIRWGILAPGHISRGFVTGLKATENAELYAVAARSVEKADAFAREFGFIRSYGSFEELADDPEVNIIYVATPHHLHFTNTLMCLEKGKPVICEKPFTINSKQLIKLVSTAREKRIFLMEAMWTRFLPGIKKTLEMIKDGSIGEIKVINADFGFKAIYDPESRLFNPHLGGGCLLDIGIYPLALSLFILGYPSDIQAVAVKSPTGVDESVSMSLSYESGAIASLHCTFATHTTTDANIYGDKGKIQLKHQWFRPTDVVLMPHDKDPVELKFPPMSNGYEYEAEEVMKCLVSGLTESPDFSLDHSLQLMRLMDDIREKCNIVYPEYD